MHTHTDAHTHTHTHHNRLYVIVCDNHNNQMQSTHARSYLSFSMWKIYSLAVIVISEIALAHALSLRLRAAFSFSPNAVPSQYS